MSLCVTARASGVIVNTMGWVDGIGLELLKYTVEALRANVVLVCHALFQ